MRNPRIAARRLARSVAEVAYEEQPQVFFKGLREAELASLPALLNHTPGRLFSELFAVLYYLGRASLPLSVGLTMHSYMTSALMTAPPLEATRERLGVKLREGHLVAVSSYGDRIQKDGVAKQEVSMRQKGGRWLARGRKMFQSMASEADSILFAADDEEKGLCLFLAPLKNNPQIEIGPRVFGGAMEQTDTRMLDYQDLVIEDEMVLSTENDFTYDVLHYCTAWFEALVAGSYLGAASSALEQARRFAREMVTPHGCLLGEMSGVAGDLGRLHLLLNGGVARAQRFADWLGRLQADEFKTQSLILLEEASAIKYTAANIVESVVERVRGIVGTRAMRPGTLLHRLCEQSLFAQLHPLMAPVIERDMGREMLVDKEFIGLDDFGG